MRKENRSCEIPPARRRQMAAKILAVGFLRYCRTARKTANSPVQESADLQQNPLGSVHKTRPCVPAGSGGYGPRDPEKGQRA